MSKEKVFRSYHFNPTTVKLLKKMASGLGIHQNELIDLMTLEFSENGYRQELKRIEDEQVRREQALNAM